MENAQTDAFILRNREKWSTVPAAMQLRRSTLDLITLDDNALLAVWEEACSDNCGRWTTGFNDNRRWYRLLYQDWVKGRDVVDFGSGLGFDGIHFAQCGARVTFVDIVPSNLEVLRRIARLKGVTESCSFLLVDGVEDLKRLPENQDAIFGFGSMHHTPAELMRPEFAVLAARLKPGGRFVMHAYPKSRWERDGSLPFEQWGASTDGAGTPWGEWYDAEKLMALLAPVRFELVFTCEWRHGDMNSIDLVKVEGLDLAEDVPAGARHLGGAVDLPAAHCHPLWVGASVQPVEGGWQVTTRERCFSMACDIPFAIPPAEMPPFSDAYVRVKARVSDGHVFIAIVDKTDLANPRFLAETELVAGAAPQVVLSVKDLRQATNILIRNGRREGGRSIVVIEAADVFLHD